MRLKQILILCGSLMLLGTGCTLRKLSEEHPYPSPSKVSKSFFQSYDAKGNIVGRKTFFAGWAPESTAGDLWSSMLNMNGASHVNIEFEITENYLLGKRVNPTYPNNRDRWETIIRIPITKHYYYELDKDGRGRETNTYVENDRRSDWSARPYMNLDFARAQFLNWDIGAISSVKLGAAENIEDIEWDTEKGFLGFTLTQTNWFSSWYTGTLSEQAKVRVNFLKFEHDPKFEKTPFNVRNADHMNILHILGKQIEGDATKQDLYAAKWDTKKKTTLYLHGFPKEYLSIAKECIELWNDEFERMGHGRPFLTKVSQRKYAFDLREPSLIWIDDRRISMAAPLGVSQTVADVKNGKMLWTGITLWGGMLHEIVNNYSPYSLDNGGTVAGKLPTVQTGTLLAKKNPVTLMAQVPQALYHSPGYSAIVEDVKKQPAFRDLNLKDPSILEKVNEIAQQIDSKLRQFQAPIMSPDFLAKQNNPDFLQNLIGMPTLQESLDQLKPESRSLMTSLLSRSQQKESFKKIIQLVKGGSIEQAQSSPSHSNLHDADLRFEDVAGQWAQAISSGQVDKTQVGRTILKNIIIHELGHSMGLGHNFKENILPAPGTVPDKYVQGWTDAKGKKHPSLLENAKNHFTNMSTVMGYPSGHTEVQFKYEDIMPGPNDQLVMEYIYNKRYAIYPKDASGKEDYEFQALPADGLIEKQLVKNGKTYVPGFFPQCNDLDASYNLDPYCNRFDRGYDATTLVKNYFDDFDNSLLSQLTAFSNTVKGSNPEVAEVYLWMRSLDLFSRTRTFYDLMRLKFKDDFTALTTGTPLQVTRNLQEFSSACESANKNERIDNEQLSKLLTDPKKKELLNLCLATSIMMKRAERLMKLPGPDTTVVNYFDRTSMASITGGDAQIRTDIFGKWKDLARIPIKISALLGTTTVNPFVNMHGWLINLPMYSDAQTSFHMSTFYPKEYINILASTMRSNLTIANSVVDEKTKIGRSILALGHLIQNSYMSNDSLSVPQTFLEEIRRQTRYDYSYVAVTVSAVKEQGEMIARSFKGTAQGMFSNQSEGLESVYIYTNGRVIVRPPLSSLLFPLTPLRWVSENSGIFFALKLNYSEQQNDNLQVANIRSELQTLLKNAMDDCINGPGKSQNGLFYFFNMNDKTRFPGFIFPTTIAAKQTDVLNFQNSVNEQFGIYYANNRKDKFSPDPRPETCEAAISAQNLIVVAASALNGFYFNEIFDFMEKSR